MTDRPRIFVDLVVVAALKTLVAEEVDVLVVNAREMLSRICLSLYVLQAVSLVPTVGEDIEGDLAANGIASDQVSA